MDMKHTPGPWKVTQTSLGSIAVSKGEDDSIITVIAEWRKERGANAKLIAAAPELLETLEVLLFAIPSQTNDADWWPDQLTEAVERANLIIKKATE